MLTPTGMPASVKVRIVRKRRDWRRRAWFQVAPPGVERVSVTAAIANRCDAISANRSMSRSIRDDLRDQRHGVVGIRSVLPEAAASAAARVRMADTHRY